MVRRRHPRFSLLLAAALWVSACEAGGSAPTSAPAAVSDVASGPGDAASGGDAPPPDDTSAPPEDTTPPTPLVPACADGAVAFAYAPLTDTELRVFPDDLWTEDDPGALTGLRVSVGAQSPWIGSVIGNFRNVYEDLATLDGWGTTAGIFLRFDGPVSDPPSGPATASPDSPLQLVEVGPPGAAVRVPFEAERMEEGTTLMLWPLRPLRPRTRYAVVVTSDYPTADGGCIRPSESLVSVLDGASTEPVLLRMTPRWVEALGAAGIAPSAVSAGAVFTTQSVIEESVAVAQDIAKRTLAWTQPPTCVAVGGTRRCNGVFAGYEYRKDGVVVDGTPQRELQYPIRIWLPKEAAGASPLLLFGHGIGGTLDQAGALADFAASWGTATVAIDAPHHGKHPAGGATDAQTAVMNFFELDLAAFTVHGLRLRDNWRQATYDKLQVIKLLTDLPDVDGDGKADIDSQRVAYFGASLGGIMGSELLALSDRLGAGVLSICGGRVTSIISDGESYAPLIGFVAGGAGRGEVQRFFCAAQTLIERGDAANYAPHVLRDRLAVGGSAAPDVLLAVGMSDEVIPSVASSALARALDVPQVPPVALALASLDVTAQAPVVANLEGVTAGLFQFDRVTVSQNGPPIAASHQTTVGSAEGVLQAVRFLQAWYQEGAARIIDPYAELGTPPLP